LTEYFDRAALKGLTDSFFKGGVNAQEIFCLLVLALLKQQFIDTPSIKFG
jgi:hypothetical protein